MRKPVILIVGEDGYDLDGNAFYIISTAYVEAIKQAGGIPVVVMDIRTAEEYAEAGDGLLLTGGPNVHAARYGGFIESKLEFREFSRTRDDLDFTMLAKFERMGKPVFGIGRGLEVMNAYFGGTLRKNISDWHEEGKRHFIHTEAGSIIRSIYGRESRQNSFHLQEIDEIAPGFRVTARAEDGSVEALESIEREMFGVLWHPERENDDAKANLEVFQHFISACSGGKR